MAQPLPVELQLVERDQQPAPKVVALQLAGPQRRDRAALRKLGRSKKR